jgi:hypothetical protein
MTDWCGAANMTVEEFKQALKDLNDKTVNIYGDRGRQRSRQDRTYASQKKGRGIGSGNRSRLARPTSRSKLWKNTGC